MTGAQLAEDGISVAETVEAFGPGNATAASEDRAADAQATARMAKPAVDVSGETWLLVYASGSDAVDVDLWSRDMMAQEVETVYF